MLGFRGGDLAGVGFQRPASSGVGLWESSPARVGAAVLWVVRGAEPGMTELEASAAMGDAGEPRSCHPIMASGAASESINGPRSRPDRAASAAAMGAPRGSATGARCRAGPGSAGG